MRRFLLFVFVLTLFTFSVTFGQSEAERLLQNRMRNPLMQCEGTLTGEGVCWHAAYDMSKFMSRYHATNDTAFLDAAVSYYDALIAKMHTSPDGYKGWVGPYIYDESYINDVHIGDAILVVHMLEFSEVVLKKSGADIRTAYQEKANQYVELAKTHLIEKWDKRGTWREDGPFGVYVSWDKYMTADNLNEWRDLPVTKSTLTLPFNKQNSMGIACLRLYRITGETRYREKALKIFNYMKSRMCLFDDHYVWNYWEPFGVWDIEDASRNKLRHWVNVHPYRNYQSGEIHEIAEAYHSGLTFEQQDIQRIINTNINVMWNGDRQKPEWRNSNYAVEKAALGKEPGERKPGEARAGALWHGLRDFSETVRELAKYTSDTPVSFKRQYEDLPVTVFERPFHSNKYLNLCAAMPCVIKQGQTSQLVSQSRISGQITIDLYTRDGKTKVKTLRNDPQKKDYVGVLLVPWQTNETEPGDYLVRWSIQGESRDFAVRIE